MVTTGMAVAVWILLAVPVTAPAVQAIDDWWHDLMADLESASVVAVAKVCSVLGSVWLMLPLFLVIGVWLGVRDQWAGLKIWLTAVIPAQMIASASKLLYARPRPDDRLVDPVTWSFPSEHSTHAAVLGITLVLVLTSPGRQRLAFLVIVVVYALFMAWTRTYLRVHWLSDVSGGVLLGASCALWAALIWQNPHGQKDPAVEF